MKQKTYILIGRSGCGKDTQLRLIEDRLKELDPGRKIIDLKTGESLREYWGEEGYANDLSREINNKGLLQPEFLVIYLWGKKLIEKIRGNEHLIFDGSPRRLSEAKVLESALRFFKRDEPTVIYLNVSRQWSIDRLTGRGRDDDTVEQINQRLDWFGEYVTPALDYLKNNKRYKFVDINGEQTIEKVFEELVEKVGLEE